MALGIACDVRRPEDCEALIRGTIEQLGGLDLLVNNAGVGRFASIQDISPEEWLHSRVDHDGGRVVSASREDERHAYPP
jgi:NAD(P)-dependent dehydrogenase (short-subunit alcohol dehydrogenase family)